ncbi:tubby C-terminal-like domain-containing protein [Roridomyces roridus]|uniref:Tubby C-terminal-like domain-containing protein n=1 Tax=Roridomyces roridus TaxID=1738132 RepID=A0AAD7BIN0_9AGAR|nr:tubby C-terminal-like domain-containing protein [Roridomyces roridus]
MQQLLDPSPPLGLFPQFVAQQQMTLVLKEKVLTWSGEDFSVKDQWGSVVVRCEGKLFSISDQKKFVDASGNHVFTLKNKIWHIHKTMEAEDLAGNVILKLRGKIQLFGSTMNITFTNFADNREVELVCKGDWIGRKATIARSDTNQIVAQIGRNFLNAREIFAGAETYQVNVAPGVDLALIAAICIALNERNRESQGR